MELLETSHEMKDSSLLNVSAMKLQGQEIVLEEMNVQMGLELNL